LRLGSPYFQEQIVHKKGKQELLTIDINSLATSEHRSLEPELVANAMWNLIGFDEVLSQCMFTNKEISLAKIVVLGKLIAPSSDLDTWKWLKTRTSILEMLNVDLSKVGKNQIYEIADLLLQHKDKIEYLLKKSEEKLFNKGCTIYLYDLTNTYFEGSNFGNELAARGKCKSKRTDCPLVSLSLVVDSYGFPIFSDIYKGNQSEPETFENVIKMLEKYKDDTLFGLIKPTIAMDRGIATAENIALLREKQYEYTVIERGPVEKKYLKEFENAKQTFHHKNSFHRLNSPFQKHISI
jgi:transposase